LIIGVAGNMIVRKRTGLYPVDILNEGLRWGIGGAFAGLLYHGLPHSWQPIPLVLGAALMYAVDVLTLTMIIGSLDGRSLSSIVRDAVDNWRFEGAMYLIGALGALDAGFQPWALLLLIIPSILIYKAVQHSYELQGGTRKLIEGLADTVDIRDKNMSGHSKRVAKYAEQMVSALIAGGKLGPLEGELIVTAARVHDIGKIEIPDAILQKSGPMSDEEAELFASHVERGAEILQCYPNFRRGVALVRHHHERWDGEGYPDKLSGYDIPLGARIIAIADSYDGMTSERPSRPAMSEQGAAAVLRSGRGTQWDPELVDVFVSCLGISQQPHLQVVSSIEVGGAVETA
jgi:putative nucleotidyltransferase with HDIG domain